MRPLVSDFVPVTAGKTYEVSAQLHVEGNSRARIYFMVSQYSAESDDIRLPNEFSTVRSYYTGDGLGENQHRFFRCAKAARAFAFT